MTPLVTVAALLLLPASGLLDEAALWFSRRALDAARDEDGEGQGRMFARSARHARLLARLLLGMAFATLVVLAQRRGDGAGPVLTVLALALVWSVAGAGLFGVYWASPLGLWGRALFRPLAKAGALLRPLLILWGYVPGMDAPLGALERVEELEEENRWLGGRTGEEEETRMLASLHTFGESLVEDVMVPREEVVGIPVEAPRESILEIVEREGYSRYPVFRDSLDTVVGVLHVFDLLDASLDEETASLVHAPHFTHATQSVAALLRELQATYNQMAVVVDEYGGIAGVVTVEDLLEELVGEIEDETDQEEILLREMEPGVYWVDGSLRVEELNDMLHLDIEEGEYDTLAGLVLEHLERIPHPGERVRVNGVWLEVMTAEPHRIQTLKIVITKRGGAKASPGERHR
jgi:CBS domain containing-hemolysin-like protein